MKTKGKRLFVAALISSSVFVGTWLWYVSSGNEYSHNGNEKPLAYVGKISNDIQRRPAARLLWQLVNTGEPLYNGEAIRTSERSEVRIQFTDSDRYLDLEPESLIVIKKSEGAIALDLMEGSLFVNAKAGENNPEAPGLVLNSAQGKVDLSKASASLSKGKGSAVDVQVLEGKASLKSEDGSTKELTSQTRIQILSPLPQKPLAMNAESPELVPFEWRGFPPGSQVSLWLGPSRRELASVKNADAGANKILVDLPFGRHYWKLVASDTNGKVIQETPVYKADIQARYAPTVVFPTADADIPTETSPFDMTFKWQKGEDTRQMALEVWSDPSLKNKMTSKSFTQEESYTLAGLKPGTYFWRMSSYYVDSNKPLLGKIQKFTVKPPALSLAQKSKLVDVQLDMPETDFNQFYIDSPRVGLRWKAEGKQEVSNWRVRVYAEDEDPLLATPIEVTETKVNAPVAKPGRYLASIEALDKNGDIVGSTQTDLLEVAPLPLLKAPGFIPTEGDLQASQDGRATLEWSPIKGAKEYWIRISKEGKELKRAKYGTNSTALRNLLPGEYDIEVTAVDAHGRESEAGDLRKLVVPQKSNLKAPTLKKIKVN